MSESPKEFDYFGTFLQKPEIRKLIHVGNLTFNDGVTVEKHLLNDVMQSVKPWIEELIENYRYFITTRRVSRVIKALEMCCNT